MVSKECGIAFCQHKKKEIDKNRYANAQYETNITKFVFLKIIKITKIENKSKNIQKFNYKTESIQIFTSLSMESSKKKHPLTTQRFSWFLFSSIW